MKTKVVQYVPRINISFFLTKHSIPTFMWQVYPLVTPSYPWATPRSPQSTLWSPLLYPLVTPSHPWATLRSSPVYHLVTPSHPWVTLRSPPVYHLVTPRSPPVILGPFGFECILLFSILHFSCFPLLKFMLKNDKVEPLVEPDDNENSEVYAIIICYYKLQNKNKK